MELEQNKNSFHIDLSSVCVFSFPFSSSFLTISKSSSQYRIQGSASRDDVYEHGFIFTSEWRYTGFKIININNKIKYEVFQPDILSHKRTSLPSVYPIIESCDFIKHLI